MLSRTGSTWSAIRISPRRKSVSRSLRYSQTCTRKHGGPGARYGDLGDGKSPSLTGSGRGGAPPSLVGRAGGQGWRPVAASRPPAPPLSARSLAGCGSCLCCRFPLPRSIGRSLRALGRGTRSGRLVVLGGNVGGLRSLQDGTCPPGWGTAQSGDGAAPGRFRILPLLRTSPFETAKGGLRAPSWIPPGSAGPTFSS